MAENTINVKIKSKHDIESRWKSNNPVLLDGEVAYSTDKGNMYKIGDGTSTWSALSYNSSAECTGNSATATKLLTARSINGASFNGTANITTPSWGTARNVYISDDAGVKGNAVSVNGSSEITLRLPSTIHASLIGNVTGNATTATALATSRSINGTSFNGTTNITTSKWGVPRTITFSGDFTGSLSIDGSSNVSCNLYPYYATIVVGNKNNYPYHRFAKLDVITSSYIDKSSTFLITQDFYGGGFGIVKISLRTNGGTSVSTVAVEWLVRKGFSVDSVKAAIYNVSGETYCDVFFKTTGTYDSAVVRNLASGPRGGVSRTWTLVNSKEVDNTTSTDSLTSTECYASITDAGATLHSKAYSMTVSGSNSGIVSHAETAAKFSTARTINGTSFNGTSNITTANWGTTRTITIGNTGKSVNGSANVTWSLEEIGAAVSDHVHNYAGSSSSGGSATSAVKLDSSAGSVTQPVYFSDGKPVACTYTLGKSVPSNAVFTDTKYTLPTASSSTLGGVKTTSTVTSNSGYTACPIISGVPYYKDTNTTYTLSSFGITATKAELNYCDGVTSNIQTQINALRLAAGNSISGAVTTAGYITSSGKSMWFMLPIADSLYGNPTISVTSVGGFTIRQNDKYLYGSTASTAVKPSSITAYSAFGGNCIKILAEFSNTTNVTNNSPCGINADIKITFS